MNGVWDKDFYLDLAHFTQTGNKAMAEVMFDGLLPLLAGGPHCVLKPSLEQAAVRF
jgi:hypothetical protein